jgi:hypothetical protein
VKFTATEFDCFRYQSIQQRGLMWKFTYRLEGPSQSITFEETLELAPVRNVPRAGNLRAANQIARLLFLVAGLSYYKAAAPPQMHLEGAWHPEEVEFLRRVVAGGLAEFAFQNDLPQALRPRITVDRDLDSLVPNEISDSSRILTPVGGGKDSCVTVNSLHRLGRDQILFSVNRSEVVVDVAHTAGLPIAFAERRIDRTLLELNQQGAHNGHVPVTAINSLAACMQALVVEAGAVAMSVEQSASEANFMWQGISVNHQWSKSLEFEGLLRDRLSDVAPGLEYFSLLRQYSEYRIAEEFSAMTDYHSVFASCGRAFMDPPRRVKWCGNCPKCRFVALVLSPFLGPAQLDAIFGRNIFQADPAPFLQLAGVGGTKPLDCVGEIAETRFIIDQAAASPAWAEDHFVQGLRSAIPEVQMPSEEQVQRIVSASPDSYAPHALRYCLDSPQ